MRGISFVVPGAVPPKSSYRHDGSEEMRRLWKRIKEYEADVGMSAVAAGARRHYGRGKAGVFMFLVNQRCDVDNATKCPIDGLKGVAFPDDKPEYLDRLSVEWTEDPDDRRPRIVYRVGWREEGGRAP